MPRVFYKDMNGTILHVGDRVRVVRSRSYFRDMEVTIERLWTGRGNEKYLDFIDPQQGTTVDLYVWRFEKI